MTSTETRFRGSGPGQAAPTGDRCPECHVSTQGQPFCPRDGQLVQPSFVVGERYVVEERLGSGGTALVFGGHHKVLGKPVALKVLRPQAARDPVEAQRFLRAARLGSQLQHENIVAVHDFGEDPKTGLVYLVMERLLGPTLAQVLAREGALPWRRAVPILSQLGRALDESHRQGIVHRDLNPRNVILTTTSGRTDVVKLCDFGLSCSAVGEDRVTVTGMAVGTPAYMPPEQVRGDLAQDHRIDLYALGVTAYEMLTGRLPHEATSAVAMIASKLTAPPVSLRERRPDLELPAALETIIMACLAEDPAARPASAAAFAGELLGLAEVPAGAARPETADLVGLLIGRYRVVQRISQGGMGAVYLAEHEVIGSKAALKVLLPEIADDPEAIDRFIQEARASSEIGSPHLPLYHDFGYLPDGRAYALMELVEGDSVADRLALGGPMPLGEVKTIISQTARAIAAAHQAGIVHRDLKPEHIMLCRRQGGVHVKILDFGIAKVFCADVQRTQAGVFMGTPVYCAPEQVLGEPVGPAADIYALGATTFEMLSGRPPFSGEPGHVLALKTQRDPAPLEHLRPTLPRAVADTVERMMARDRTLRPRGMLAVAAEVEAWPDVETPAAGVRSAKRTSWAPGWLAAAVAAGCLAAALTAGLWTRSEPSEAPLTTPHPAAAPTRAAATVAPNPAAPEVAPPAAPPVVRPLPPEAAAKPLGPSHARGHKPPAHTDRRPPRDRKPAPETTPDSDPSIVIANPYE